MSLDNIQLPHTVIQELYKNSLVDLESNEPIRETLNNNAYPFLGANKKNVLLIVSETSAAFLQDEHLALVMKMMSACQLTMADISIVNAAHTPGLNLTDLNEQFEPRKIIIFGLRPSELDFPLEFPDFQVQKYNGQSYLTAPGINEVATNTDIKKQLWQSLQKMFEL